MSLWERVAMPEHPLPMEDPPSIVDTESDTDVRLDVEGKELGQVCALTNGEYVGPRTF
jgi:hypothetical protein